jgi:ABC-type Fe3+ transport system substrate-binding protein
MRTLLTVCLIALAALAVVLTLACGSGPKTPAAGTDKLSILSPHTTDIRDNMLPLFKAWYRRKTGRAIEVEWINQGGSSDNLRFIRSEFARTPQGIHIDLFWGGGISPSMTLKKEGLLQRTELDPAVMAGIPKSVSGIPVYDPDLMWYGSCLSTFGILSHEMVRQYQKFPEIRTWEDLTQPAIKGWISVADPRHSGVGHVAFDIILQAYGWKKGWQVLTMLSANVKKFKISSKDVVKDLVSGDAAYTLVVDYYAWREVEDLGTDKVRFVVPEGLSIVNPDCFAVIKGADHPQAAKLFMEYILSPEGQKVWMLRKGAPGGPPNSSLYRLSVLPPVYDAVRGQSLITINPFASASFIDYDVTLGERLWDIQNDLMGTLLVDAHDSLATGWEGTIRGGLKPAAVEALCRMPLTQAEAEDLAARWGDEKLRNQTINAWLQFAQARSREALRLSR